MSQPTATCENCRFWNDRSYHGDNQRTCKRRSPFVPLLRYPGGYDANKAEWPVTWAGDWCGEHQTPESVESIDEFVRRTRRPSRDIQMPAQGRDGSDRQVDGPDG